MSITSKFIHSLKLILLAILVPVSAGAELRLPSIFSDHMVLQRDIPVNVWGFDTPGTVVTVEFAGEIYTAEAGEDGKWAVVMDPLPANSEPQTLVVQGTSEQQLADVLVGDVCQRSKTIKKV